MVEHPFFLEVNASYQRGQREREVARARLAALATGDDNPSFWASVRARLKRRLVPMVYRTEQRPVVGWKLSRGQTST